MSSNLKQITILDSTLREGMQAEGLSFSLQDKLHIVQTLDDFGLDFIEAGAPMANPGHLEFFRKASRLPLRHARLCAFGSTRHRDVAAEKDLGLQALMDSEAPVVSLFGKASLPHVTQILGATADENLDMIDSSIRLLVRNGRQVLFDAEHFFDGYADNPSYALQVLRTAHEAGAVILVLCDTNGGTLPTHVLSTTREVKTALPDPVIGIHTHNDCGCAVANSLLAVEGGALHVQGTFSGVGERCGNANLSIVIPNLLLKKNCRCQIENMEMLTPVARKLSEISNILLPNTEPYVGQSAFAHKAGMHVDAVLKNNSSFEHISPEVVGNHRRFLVSEVSGRSTLVAKVHSFAPQLTKDSPRTAQIIQTIKEMEFRGYQFEAADASLELLVRRTLGLHSPHYELLLYKTSGEFPALNGEEQATAMVQIKVGDTTEISAALGNGPVNALDQALRRALKVFYPIIDKAKLTDYKVRVLETNHATAAKVRVLIESSDGRSTWTTVGVSTDIIEASWIALTDSIEYYLDKSTL